MKSKIINTVTQKYKKIVLIIIKNLESSRNIIKLGRPLKYTHSKCLNYLFNILSTGLSWNKLGILQNIQIDSIRKRCNKWLSLNIFTNAYNSIFEIYRKKCKNKFDLSNLYIDSTVISNFSGSLDYGYNIKIKNKKSIKISAIVDDNKIPHLIKVTPSNPHDAKIMGNPTGFGDMLNEYTFNQEINLIGDKGYIKTSDYINNLKNNKKINLITPYRKNNIKKVLTREEESLLKKRVVVEHFFSILKKSYLRISIINDKINKIYYNYIMIAAGLMIHAKQ